MCKHSRQLPSRDRSLVSVRCRFLFKGNTAIVHNQFILTTSNHNVRNYFYHGLCISIAWNLLQTECNRQMFPDYGTELNSCKWCNNSAHAESVKLCPQWIIITWTQLQSTWQDRRETCCYKTFGFHMLIWPRLYTVLILVGARAAENLRWSNWTRGSEDPHHSAESDCSILRPVFWLWSEAAKRTASRILIRIQKCGFCESLTQTGCKGL